MIYILTFENNLLPGKYFSHFWENRFHLLGNLKITLYQINIFFHFWGTSYFHFWGMDMLPSHQPILKLSYEESLLFPHKSTATIICFLTFGITLLPGKYLFPTSGELISTSWEISIFTFYQVNTLFSTSWEISISTLYQINTLFLFWGTSYFHFWGTDM